MTPPDRSNTIIFTVGTWKNYLEHAYIFQKSAEKNRLEIEIVGKEKVWKSFYENKIKDVLQWLVFIREQQPEIRFILYADSRDSIFTADLDMIVDRYRQLHVPGKILFSSALPKRAYPFSEDWFVETIENQFGSGGVLNAGGYMGNVDDAIRLFTKVVDLHEQLLNRPSSLSPVLQKVYDFTGRSFCWDDQFLLECLQADGDHLLHVDRAKELFALWIHGWPDPVRRKPGCMSPAHDIGRALVLHSPIRFREEPDRCLAWAKQYEVIDE